MESLNALATLLGNGFFPIIVCAILFWYVYKKDQQHKQEMDEMRKTIENNTIILQQNTEVMRHLVEVITNDDKAD